VNRLQNRIALWLCSAFFSAWAQEVSEPPENVTYADSTTTKENRMGDALFMIALFEYGDSISISEFQGTFVAKNSEINILSPNFAWVVQLDRPKKRK
jgi:hypothetical protein